MTTQREKREAFRFPTSNEDPFSTTNYAEARVQSGSDPDEETFTVTPNRLEVIDNGESQARSNSRNSQPSVVPAFGSARNAGSRAVDSSNSGQENGLMNTLRAFMSLLPARTTIPTTTPTPRQGLDGFRLSDLPRQGLDGFRLSDLMPNGLR